MKPISVLWYGSPPSVLMPFASNVTTVNAASGSAFFTSPQAFAQDRYVRFPFFSSKGNVWICDRLSKIDFLTSSI
jgi:hypothetical protein